MSASRHRHSRGSWGSRPSCVLAGGTLLGALLLAACGPSVTPVTHTQGSKTPRGIVTGVAVPCHPQAYESNHLGRIPVTVTLTAGNRTVATQTVRGSHTYRFEVAPGSYVVSSNGEPPHPAHVTVRPGQVVKANLGSTCL